MRSEASPFTITAGCASDVTVYVEAGEEDKVQLVLEGVQINDGTIRIAGGDDGINGAAKSGAYLPAVEINGGEITVTMASGDTDGIDSNGSLIINGGTIDVTGQSAFDYDGTGQYNGGTIIVNGQQVSSLPNQMMGGRGGMGGRQWR